MSIFWILCAYVFGYFCRQPISILGTGEGNKSSQCTFQVWKTTTLSLSAFPTFCLFVCFFWKYLLFLVVVFLYSGKLVSKLNVIYKKIFWIEWTKLSLFLFFFFFFHVTVWTIKSQIYHFSYWKMMWGLLINKASRFLSRNASGLGKAKK